MLSRSTRLGSALRAPLDMMPDADARIRVGPNRGLRWRRSVGIHGCWLGTYEFSKARRIANYVEAVRPKLAFDVGANAGYYTLLLAARSTDVVAIEPLPRNLADLQLHLEMNQQRLVGHVVVEGVAAIGDTVPTVRFDVGPSTFEGRVGDGDLEVPARSLDQLADQYGLPDLVKMDIEGGELEALTGASHMLDAGQPLQLFVATHSDDLTLGSTRFLTDHGFRVRSLGGGPVMSTSRDLVATRR